MRDAVGRHVKHVKCVLIRQQPEGVCVGGRGYVVFLGGKRLWGGACFLPRGRVVWGDGSCFLEGSLDFFTRWGFGAYFKQRSWNGYGSEIMIRFNGTSFCADTLFCASCKADHV